jgi:thiamine pyrophosphate-dependent acetolactate synthase large subunit-like protein
LGYHRQFSAGLHRAVWRKPVWSRDNPFDIQSVQATRCFGANGLRIETPDQISSTIKKALAMQGPVIVGVPVDYRDNHQFMEIVHPSALN